MLNLMKITKPQLSQVGALYIKKKVCSILPHLLLYNYFTMSAVLGRCDFRTIFIFVINIIFFGRILLHKEGTQFEQPVQREEHDT